MCCGEFSLANASEKGYDVAPISVEEYAAFIQKYDKYIYAYFNLDKIADPITSSEHQAYLQATVGRASIPIWHVQSDWSELDKLVEQDYELIGIGGSAKIHNEKVKKEKFQEIFKRHSTQNFHCLGLSSSLLWEFPWFSSDSTSWLNPRKNGAKNALITPFGLVNAPENWDVSQSIVFNIRQLVVLEDPSQPQLEMMLPPPLPRPVQLELDIGRVSKNIKQHFMLI